MSGILLIISGPSGVGKTTVCKQLEQRLDAFLSISCTTRARRDNEAQGRDYHFVSRAEFEQQLERGGFLEYAQAYGGHYYGSPAGPVEESLATGKVVILEIEIEGAIQVKRRFPRALAIYILAPNPTDQQDRLVGRQKDSSQAIEERLNKADGEIGYAKECGIYDRFLVNETVVDTVDEIVKIVREKQQI